MAEVPVIDACPERLSLTNLPKQNSDVRGLVFISLSDEIIFLLDQVTHVFGNNGFVKVILNKK